MKLECIKDDGYDVVHTLYIENYPVKGKTYTVRKRVHTSNGLGYLLEEISNPVMPNGVEPNFGAWRFEPVQETDLITTNQKKDDELFSIRQCIYIG